MNYTRTPNAGYPPTTHKAVTLDRQFDFPSQWVYVGAAGALAMLDLFGNLVTYTGLNAGTFIWGQFTQVNTSGTTATGLVYAY